MNKFRHALAVQGIVRENKTENMLKFRRQNKRLDIHPTTAREDAFRLFRLSDLASGSLPRLTCRGPIEAIAWVCAFCVASKPFRG